MYHPSLRVRAKVCHNAEIFDVFGGIAILVENKLFLQDGRILSLITHDYCGPDTDPAVTCSDAHGVVCLKDYGYVFAPSAIDYIKYLNRLEEPDVYVLADHYHDVIGYVLSPFETITICHILEGYL